MSSAINETLIRDIVAEVMGRLSGAVPAKPAATSGSCGCDGGAANGHGAKVSGASRGRFGIFQDAGEACVAAHEAFLQLQEKGVAARRKVEEIVKTLAEKNAEEWGRV